MKKHIKAAIYLYGIITLEDLEYILNYYNVNYDNKSLFDTLDELSNDLRVGLNYDDHFVCNDLFTLDSEQGLDQAYDFYYDRYLVPLNLLDKDSFLKFSDEFYDENINELNEIAKYLKENEISNLSTEDLIDHLSEYKDYTYTLLDEDAFFKRMKQIGFKFENTKILKEFKSLMKNSLKNLHLYTFRGHKELDFNLLEKEYSDLMSLLEATCNLYGYVTRDSFKQLYKHYYKKELNDSSINYIIKSFDDTFTSNSEFISSYFFNLNNDENLDFITFIDEQIKNKERYIMPLDELLMSDDDLYIEDFTLIENIISTIVNEKLIESEVDELYHFFSEFALLARFGINEELISDYIKSANLKLKNEETFELLFKYLLDLYFKQRSFVNKGFVNAIELENIITNDIIN